MLGIVWTRDGMKAIEGPHDNPEKYRIVPMYWVPFGGDSGMVCGERMAYTCADRGWIVERTA